MAWQAMILYMEQPWESLLLLGLSVFCYGLGLGMLMITLKKSIRDFERRVWQEKNDGKISLTIAENMKRLWPVSKES